MSESIIKRAVLAVSFGTSYDETRKKTIDKIEESIRRAYPDVPLYRAWTSGMIRRKVEKRDGIHIFCVREALEQMRKDGIREVLIQPTHVINGLENELMKADAQSFAGKFDKISIGTPLLTSAEDNERVIRVIAAELQPAQDEALVLMGHGTEHYANAIYAALDYQFKEMGYPNIFIGTVEAYPSLDTLIRQVQRSGLKKILLAPFMIVAGDHAENDLAGEEDSWKTAFEEEGYEVRCVLRGLGEYEGIRRLFLEHLAAVMK